jgi:hypothetical protein
MGLSPACCWQSIPGDRQVTGDIPSDRQVTGDIPSDRQVTGDIPSDRHTVAPSGIRQPSSFSPLPVLPSTPDVDVPSSRPHAHPGNEAPFHQLMRLVPHDLPVLAGAWL